MFGNSTAGGAYVPGMSDYVVMVKEGAKVFLGGPPLVKMATGEESDDESLGGAEMHARTSGLADYLAVDEHDAIRIGRSIVRHLNWRKARHRARADVRRAGPRPRGAARHRADRPQDPVRPARGHRAASSTASEFDEFKPLYGSSLVTGFAQLHGYPIGILANAQGVLFSQEAQKAAQFIQLANQTDTPLLFLHNTTGYMVGAEYEQGGIIKHGAQMINAVSNSTVPHLSVVMGASYGAGHYGMSGRAYDPRFMFSWPNAKSAVMGPAQLAGVISIVARGAAEAKGQPYDEEGDEAMRAYDRGADREGVAGVLHLRDALRRRRHRPARHPHDPRHLPQRDQHRARSRAPRDTGCSACERALVSPLQRSYALRARPRSSLARPGSDLGGRS